MPKLIVLAGLPGVGKSAIARELARQIGAVHLRIDSIEQAIRDSGVAGAIDDSGYRVAYAVAEDNLRLGLTVVADSVNPLPVTRDCWLEVAKNAGVHAVEVEIQCSHAGEHRRRVESRTSDIPGFRLPTWEEVTSRDYHPWNRDHIVVDTTAKTVDESVKMLRMIVNRPVPGEAGLA